MDVSKLHPKHQKPMDDIIKSDFFPPVKKQEMYEFYLELSKHPEKDWVKEGKKLVEQENIMANVVK